MKRLIVVALDKLDHMLDAVLYRPAVVKLTMALPRWWLCDLAKLSLRLDERWATGYWREDSWVPGGPCEACGRRAAIVTVGGWGRADSPKEEGFLATRKVELCGWCKLEMPVESEEGLQRALAAAKERSTGWHWK